MKQNKTHIMTMVKLTTMIGIKTGTMASVIQGTVRPRGTCGRPGLASPKHSDDDDAREERAKGTKQYAKKRVCDEYYYY